MMREWFSYIWELYKKPLIVLFGNGFLYHFLGSETLYFIISFICIRWIRIVAYCEKHKDCW